MIFVVLVFWAADYPQLQVMTFIIVNVSYLIYTVSYRPLWRQGKFEIFNECCALAISLLILTYTECMDDPDTAYYIGGYGFIGIFSFNVAVNFTFILGETLRSSFLQIRFKLRKLKSKCRQKVKKD